MDIQLLMVHFNAAPQEEFPDAQPKLNSVIAAL